MKKILNVVQWALAILCLVGSFSNGFHFSSIFLILAAVLFAPLPPIRRFFKKKLKIKQAFAIVLAVILFFVGISNSPISPKLPTEDNNGSATTTVVTTTTAPVQSTTTQKTDGATTTTKPQSGETVTPSAIPAYAGKPYVTLNNNNPTFSDAELTTIAYESYSALDNLGRCGVAIASCGTEIMPAKDEERGSISSVKPSGWVQAQYDIVDGKYLYNRSHLIGWQLSAENANKKNLITGTRYMNTKGMLPFENMVADYIHETGNHVAYRITPMYDGSNLLPSGVQMEAFSVEDNGEGICFNVYVYNVQPGVVIDYATGKSHLEGSTTKATTTATTVIAVITTTKKTTTTTTQAVTTTTKKPTTTTKADTTMVWVKKSGKLTVYHSVSSCSGMKGPLQISLSSAKQQGLKPCSKCY